MGGTALECLVRTGIGHFIISDIDVFEVSNMNRQMFADLQSINQSKVDVAARMIQQINPEVKVEIFRDNWTENLDGILTKVDLVINGCDSHRATVLLMRKAQQHGKTVIDAFASTLPSVYVVGPEAARPEEFMRFPTRDKAPEQWSEDDIRGCALQETIYVLTNSSTIQHVILDKASEMIAGKRKRISLAPMVWMTGVLMSYEALKVLLKKPGSVSEKGLFYNPWKNRIEKPLWAPIAWLKSRLVQLYLQRLSK